MMEISFTASTDLICVLLPKADEFEAMKYVEFPTCGN
jgi:hypothetical protein